MDQTKQGQQEPGEYICEFINISYVLKLSCTCICIIITAGLIIYWIRKTKEMAAKNTLDDCIRGHQRRERRLEQLIQTLQQKKEHVFQCRTFYDRFIQVLHSDKMNKNLLYHFHVQNLKFDEILRKRHTSLVSGEVRIMIIGDSSAGKSTFLNVLMQGNYLPIGDHEAGTRIVCELHNCPSKRAFIHYKERFKMRPIKLKLTRNCNDECWKRLQQCIVTGRDGKSDPPKGVLRVEIYWPLLFVQMSQWIKLAFVDSPGFDDDYADPSIAERIAKSSDLYLFVINNAVNHGVAKDGVLKMMKLLEELVQTEESIFDPDCTTFFCNKWDLVPTQKAETLKTVIIRRLQTVWPRISSHHLFFCSFAEALKDVSNGAISEKYYDFLDHTCTIVEHAVHLKVEKHFRWLINFLETCTAVIANINAMQDFNEQQRKKVRAHIVKLNGDLTNFQDECQSKCKELASQKPKAIRKVKPKLLFCLESTRRKPFQWKPDDIPTRRQGEAWSDYKERLKQKIVQRINDTIMKDDGVKSICEEYHESHKEMLEQLCTKFNELESRMSLHGPCQVVDGYDREKLAFLYNLLAPFRKLFIVLKDILETNHVLDTRYSDNGFNTDSIHYMKTQTEEVLSSYVTEMQLQSTATDIVESIWDSVEKTINCFVACAHYRNKCLAEIFDSELDKKTLEYWKDQFFLPEVKKCSKVYISIVMKHEIDQSRLEIDRENPRSKIADGGCASIMKGKLKEEDRKLDIAAKIIRRPASECDIDIFKECFLLRQLTLKAEASDGNVFPHLVKFYGSSYVEKDEVMELQLIMELCDTDLGKRIKKGYLLSFSDEEKQKIMFPGMDDQPSYKESVFHAIDITRQAASGLEFIHKNGIVHRDVKANNFLMNQREYDILIKISDFGESRDNDVTTTRGKSVGTKIYHAPEFYSRLFAIHTFPTDVYSFGLLIWEVWHGERVFDSVSSDCLHPDTFYKYPDWKGDHAIYRARDLKVLMKKCCHKMPEKRPEMKYVLDQLTRLAEKSKDNS